MKIAVTSKSFSKNDYLINELKKYFMEVRLNLTGSLLEGDELIEFLQDCDGVIVALEQITPEVIDSLPKLKIISKFGVGLNNIDLEYCKQKDIRVGWTAGVNKTSVAEMTLGFMLMLIRNLYITSNKLSKGIWDKDGGFSLYGKTIGIVGAGHIGKEVINLLKPFNCNILVNDIINQNEYYLQNNLTEVCFDEIIKQSDILSIHTPLTGKTHNLINKDVFSKMKNSSFLINTARGGIVNLVDLKDALKTNKISGAAIDVYNSEPPEDSELLSLANLICTPHIGGNSNEAVVSMGESAIKHIKEYFIQQNDEISYEEYCKDKKNLDKFLVNITLSTGNKFKTYKKLSSLEDSFFEYYCNLQNSFNFKIYKNDLIIDVGAHHGIISIGCAQKGAKVISYEPNPINFDILNRNIYQNNDLNITAYEYAVSNRNETLIFNFGKTSTTGALKELDRDWKRTITDIEVKAVNLNNILDNHDKIKLLKLDCEGAEYDILNSLSQDNINKLEYFYIEVHPIEKYKPKEIEPILDKLGFIYRSKYVKHGCYEYFCKKEDN